MPIEFSEDLTIMVEQYGRAIIHEQETGEYGRAERILLEIYDLVYDVQEKVAELENRLAATDHSEAGDLPEFLKPQAE